MELLTIEQIRAKLIDRRVSMVSEATGLHYNTIRWIRDNADANPTLDTMKKLSAYLSE